MKLRLALEEGASNRMAGLSLTVAKAAPGGAADCATATTGVRQYSAKQNAAMGMAALRFVMKIVMTLLCTK